MRKNLNKSLPTRPLFGIPIFIGTEQQLLTEIESHVKSGQGIMTIFTPNPEQISLSFHDREFKQLLANSSINIPDGQGLIWALGRKPGVDGEALVRIAGREVFHDILSVSQEKKWKVFLLGGKSGSAKKVASKYGCDFHPGATDIRRQSQNENSEILEAIGKSKPDIVFVAYGAPFQERWISENQKELERIGVKVAMVVGGAIDYEAGLVPQVPAQMEAMHLEWLWRLFKEPWRWKRQLKGLEFFMKVLGS